MSKKLNIIEAMKMPIGTLFEVLLNDEKFGCVAKIVKSSDACTKKMVWDNRADSEIIVTDSIANAVFIKVQKPVSFMEAVAKAKTNRFRIEHELLNSGMDHTLLTTLRILSEYYNNDQIVDIIQNGKCYIEESEDDSNDIR